MVQIYTNQTRRPYVKKWTFGILLICIATLLFGCSVNDQSGVNISYVMKAPGEALYYQPTGFSDMYEKSEVIMVVQPSRPLSQRENHSSEGSSQTYLFASCRVTDMIANRSGEEVNVGDLVSIAERMYFESSDRLRDIDEAGRPKPDASYTLDTLMIKDFFFFPLAEGTRYLVFCDVNHFGVEDGPAVFWPQLFGVMDLSSIEVVGSELYFAANKSIPGLISEGELEKYTSAVTNVLKELGQIKAAAAQRPDLAPLFRTR